MSSSFLRQAVGLMHLAVLLVAVPVPAQTVDSSQTFPLSTVFYFNSYDSSRTVWDHCQIYHSPNSTVLTTSQSWNGREITGLPVQNVDGARVLVLKTTNNGYWNIPFLIGDGAPVNLTRLGDAPTLHLRLRWHHRLPGDADDWTISLGNSSVLLSPYVTPAVGRWHIVDIPLTAFTHRDPKLDLTHINSIVIAGAHLHTEESLAYISELAILPGPPAVLRVDRIKTDQSGWRPHDPKHALLTYPAGTNAARPAAFQVCRAGDGRIVYAGRLTARSGSADWNPTGDIVFDADFTPVVGPGRYKLKVPVLSAVSSEFTVGERVYDKDFRDALRFYYYERSGYPIAASYGEGYSRPAVFPGNGTAAYHHIGASGSQTPAPLRDVRGGWLDAGDPSLQTADHAVAAWWLLETLKTMGRKVPPGSLHLPEKSGPGESDLVPLVDFGLHWMAKMQNPDGSVLPLVSWGEGDRQQCSGTDSPSAAWAAGVFAKAYLILRTVPGCKSESEAYLAKARLSWSWLTAHPNPVTAETAETPVDARTDQQCRMFAAIELFNATGEAVYHRAFLAPFQASGSDVVTAFGGSQTGFGPDHVMGYLNGPAEMGYLDYADSPQTRVNRSARQHIRQAFLHQAAVAAYDPARNRVPYLARTPYRFAMLYPGHLYWGSSATVLAALGVVFTRAYEWTGDKSYLNAALENLHFIHGRNPISRHFVSGEASDYAHGCDFYSQFWTDLHHQPPGVLGAFINGDGLLSPHIKDPWKRFINYQEASAEEPDVSWNCEYAYLAGYFASGLSGERSSH